MLLTGDLSYVCWPPRGVSSFWCFNGHVFRFSYWIQFVDWNGLCLGHILWSILWSKTVPYACLEIWSFEMMVLLSGLLPNPKLETSVLSISLNTCSMVYMIPLGLSGATSIRVSNELGAGRPQRACLAVCIAIFMVASEGTLAAVVMSLERKLWGYCYSREEEVVNYVAEMLLLVAGSHFVDGIQSVLSGAIRGCGRQKIGAIVNLGAYYLIGIPSAVLLAFLCHIGGKGLWMGIIVALIAQALLLGIIILCTNWEKEAKKATDRVYDSMIPIEIS